MQRNLEAYVAFYSRDRAYQGYHTEGRTPSQAVFDGIEAMRREEAKPEAG